MSSLAPHERLPAIQETQVQSLGWEDPLEKEKVTDSTILAWRILRSFPAHSTNLLNVCSHPLTSTCPAWSQVLHWPTDTPCALPSVPPTVSPEPPHLWLPCFSPWQATAGGWRVEVRETGDLLPPPPCRAGLYPPLVRWHSPRSLRPQGPGQGCLHSSAGTDCSHYCRFRVFHHPQIHH